ncbi:MAG: replication protein P [Ewingella sp.]
MMMAIKNRDASALAQLVPEQQPQRVVNPDAEKLVDTMFTNLMQIFPAARQTALSTPADIAAAKRQWIMAFAESGVTTLEQVKAGMRVARQQETDFWPSCGKFIGWCKAGAAESAGLPSVDEVMDEFKQYCSGRGYYSTAEAYPWSAPIMYWIITDVRRLMLQNNYTEGEVRKSIQHQLNKWAKRLAKGEQIPAPVIQLAAPKATMGPTPAQILYAEYKRRKAAGWL